MARKVNAIGVVTAKGDNYIELKADGEEKARVYVPHWVGGAPAQGGGPDKKMLEVFSKLKVGSRVEVKWEFEERLRAVDAGVNDFISQPVDPAELRLRSASLLRLKEATDGLKRHRAELELTVAQRTRDLRRALDEMVQTQRTTYAAHLDAVRRLALAAEFKDRDAASHIERVGRYCELLGRSLNLAPPDVERLRFASSMHDVGKIGIPGSILVLPGKLHPTEHEVMRQHTVFGAYLLHGSKSELLQMGEAIAISHHERWDGTGYPKGIAGDAIPLAGRICAVADVFDALTSDRPYRAALPNHTVYDMMAAESGQHFDPAVLDAFLAQRSAVEAVQQQYRYIAGPE